MERRLAAILAADVVGYSRLMGEDSRRHFPEPTSGYLEATYAFMDRETLEFFLDGLKKAGWDG